MNKKALFFDVDGTLLSEITRAVPKSTVLALSEARKAGHLVFINSGRVYCHLGKIKKLVEADGYLCGCGTYVVVKNEVIFSSQIPKERGLEIKDDIVKYGFIGLLEARDAIYVKEEAQEIPLVKHLRKVFAEEGVLSARSWEDAFSFDKFCMISQEHSDVKGMLDSLAKDFTVIDRGNAFYECVPKNCSKATAMAAVLTQYGIGLDDAYAFGDSMNDFSMFEYSKNAILMGKHDQELEPYASFVTKTVEESGIAHAMIELGIIKESPALREEMKKESSNH